MSELLSKWKQLQQEQAVISNKLSEVSNVKVRIEEELKSRFNLDIASLKDPLEYATQLLKEVDEKFLFVRSKSQELLRVVESFNGR